MKKTLISCLRALLFSTCIFIFCYDTNVQVFETKTTNTKLIQNQYVFENDTLKISYNLWKEHGLMAFNVYNKLSIPIYIDWKNSAFIVNSKKLDFGPDIEERITSLPPKAELTNSRFVLIPSNIQYIPVQGYDTKTVPSTYNPKNSTVLFETEFSYNDSPLKFRNFLVVATSEKFEKEFYIDNEFYVSKSTVMRNRNFCGQTINSNPPAPNAFEYPYKIKTGFYLLNVPEINTISHH